MKQCKKCETEKSDEDFRDNRRVCKECEKAHGREYRRNNKEKSKKWVEENVDRMKELQANWYHENKEKINTKFRESYYSQDTDFKKIKNYRTAINHMLGGTQKTNQYIGCKRDKLIEWCKSSFEEGMTMENYGVYWVVDHVIPLDTLKSSPELFKILTPWYNIMPVISSFNLQKNKKIDVEQIRKHLENINEFRKLKPDQEYLNYLRDTLLRETPLEPLLPP